jgi:hypothetical protein
MDHHDFIINEISKELDILFSTFDTRMLATAMMVRSAQALRATHASGMWRVEDVRAVIEGALENVYEPLPKEQMPKVVPTGRSGTLQ